MRTLVSLEPRLDYVGIQLRPHFIRERFGLKGDAAVVFRGACRVEGTALVDLEDREAGAFIASNDMLHLMLERFEPDLPRMVMLQRLLADLVASRVRASVPEKAAVVRRDGDDVFVGDGKLTVSIATVSPVSGLIHLGVNVDDRDTPVTTAALDPLGIPVASFAQGLVDDLVHELDGIADAVSKVRPAHGGGDAG
ncbi:MAG: hypothetical protein CMJ83_02015 [Planctomycetes bacterium]|nr:hypothetical protein [Planctomycetota bacterium]